MEKIKAALIGTHDNQIYEIKNLIQLDEIAIVGIVKLGDNTFEKISSLRPQVILLQCGEEISDALDLAQSIFKNMPGCSVLMIRDKVDISLIQDAMLAGVRRVLLLPISSDELTESIKKVFSLEKSRVLNEHSTVSAMQSKVVTIFGSKGGIGKTTIAVNLAVLLSQMRKRVAVIDADLQFGDVNVFFDLEAKNTISDLSQSKDASDINTIKRMTVLHQSGVSILCAPKSPEYSEYVTAKNVETIITTMRPHYDYIIIDTMPFFNDISITALENADLVLLISGIDISCLRNTKTSVGILESLQQMDKVELVLNKVTGSMIAVKDVVRILDKPVKNQISYDMKTALSCHNNGIPIVLNTPRSQIAKELKLVAGNVIQKVEKDS